MTKTSGGAMRIDDFDWPPVPYTQYLQEQLTAQTQYEYINPALDRRYDPVVIGGNAMHPVIQRGDVILIDRGMTEPEDGRATAVSVGDGRTIIGYWRNRRSGPVLEQERTKVVIDLTKQYPGWKVYGIVTKIIGRGIPPHPPDVASGSEEARMADVSPGQAQYVVERLIAERRVSQADIQKYLREMQAEITDLEQRIASLRAHVPSGPAPAAAKAKPTPKKRGSGRKGHLRGIAGTFAVLTRSLPAADRAKYEAIRTKDGLKAAVLALRKATK